MSQRNRFFLRRFGRMFIIVLIPALILFVMAFSMASRSIDSEIRMKASQSVDSVEANLSLVMGNVFQQNGYLTNMTRMSAALRRVLYGNTINYGDAVYMRSLQSQLMSMTASYDYIDTALIYYAEGDRYLSSDSSIHVLQGIEEENWLELFLTMPPGQESTIATRTISENTATENTVLTVCQRLLMQDGCMVVDLNLLKLQNMLATFAVMPGQVIYLMDTQGKILARSTDEDAGRFDMEAYVLEEGGMEKLSKREESWWTESGLRSRSHICLIDYGEPGMYIVSVTPRSVYYSRIGSELHIFALVVLLDFIIVVFLAYSATRQSFNHIYNVLWMFEEAEQGKMVESVRENAKDEYDIIMNNIVRMFLNTTYLNTQLKEKQYREENAELKALQLQINPHFLFNTLQTLDLEALKLDKGGNMHRIIASLSEILKYALEDPGKPVTLQEELDYLKKYMVVQSYRFGDHFIVYYDVEEELLGASVFRMMLQPVLENSLLHGIRHMTETRGYINVDICRDGDWMQIAVSDNGSGMDADRLKKVRKRVADPESSSIGLTNLNRRLILYYGEESTLHIESEVNEGTRVSFRIPSRAEKQQE